MELVNKNSLLVYIYTWEPLQRISLKGEKEERYTDPCIDMAAAAQQ